MSVNSGFECLSCKDGGLIIIDINDWKVEKGAKPGDFLIAHGLICKKCGEKEKIKSTMVTVKGTIKLENGELK